MSNTRRTKYEEAVLISRLVGAVERRVTTPRGSRWAKYQKLEREWAAANPTLPFYECPIKRPDVMTDRSGDTVYGLFWNNRLLKLGRTTWTNQSQAIATFNTYVRRLLTALEQEEDTSLPADLQHYVKEKGHRGVKAITHALRESGILQVREIETIPMPPDEE